MICVDIETSGLDKLKCGIWQIGAVNTDNPNEVFLQEARIDDEDELVNIPGSLLTVQEVTGKTEQDLRDFSKQSQKQLLENFFKWVSEKDTLKNFLCQNPQFDFGFLEIKSKKYGLKMPVGYRCFDLHSISQIRHLQIKGEFLIKGNSSEMGLTYALDFVGIKDTREVHNALEDAKLTAECFFRLIFGKCLFPEFEEFAIPNYLKKI